METEVWKPIPGWEGYYEVSNCGQVRSLPRTIRKADGTIQKYKGKILRGRPGKHGHVYVQLCRNAKPKGALVHRLVMAAFVGPCPEGMEVCHNDGVPGNNLLSNLRYDSHTENAYDSVTHNVHPQARKSHCKRGHEFNDVNTVTRKWRSSTHRRCRACSYTFDKHRGVAATSPEFKMIADHYYQSFQGGKTHV